MTTLLTGGSQRREALDDDVDLARDRALVTRAQEGDRTAFDDLYLRYHRRLYRFCLRRLHDTHEAEDVSQEAFARAWRALPNFGGDRRFYPWLSVIASHLCTDVLRRRNRSTPVAEFHQGNVASTEDGGEELMLAAVDCDLVAKAFKRLSDRHQRILHLREGSGWSYQRIADHEGVGITAVETLLWRARQALKREFASLAGADGRTAAVAGGLLSLAGLRRLLRLPVHSARRVVTQAHRGSLVAMGSAAAATAMVVAASLTAPSAVSHVPLPSVPRTDAHITAVPPGTSAPTNNTPAATPDSGSPVSDGSGAVDGSAKPAASAPAIPGAPQAPFQGVQNGLNNGGAKLSNTVGLLGNGLTSGLGQIDNDLSNLPVLGSTIVGAVTTPVLGTADDVLGTTTGAGSGSSDSTGTGSTDSTSGTTSNGDGGAVGSTILKGTQTAGDVVGGM